ncbi:PD-(D/E)XK nuclease family protein [Xenophilus sp. Marseille-Q4582]|uniref:PD-(D/E)XK nuclease family protein n=1 Tax=Xenophilus sp. Marseille-Q4582 TaxID=2866600 RepID=UPI001CE4360F|nr:PD-(D/E)XK nuclease family protein [Xenophilus sp. Marseille-Q4582]
MSFYELQGPTGWAAPPSMWSSTSLDDVEACPRRWQLMRSRWGEFEGFPVRPHPAAIEGQIVHEALDRLTRACGQRGNPAFGSAEFSAALNDADFFPCFARAVIEWQQRLTAHPRPGPAFRLRASGEELANRAVRMFREQYKPDDQVASQAAERATDTPADVKALLKHKRALSEVKLTHPKLPFLGILDRVQHTGEGIEVVDFKTGKPSDKHRKQLLHYALLWWRKTGDAPVRVSAQYLDGVESWPVTRGALEDVEADLVKKLPMLTDALGVHPAAAKPGTGCHTCAVRARCAAGWAVGEEAALVDGRGDAELVVKAKAGDHGFLARSRTGAEIAVVYEAPVAKLLPEHVEGQVLRVLDGVWKEKRTQLELKAWTEVFVVRDVQCVG